PPIAPPRSNGSARPTPVTPRSRPRANMPVTPWLRSRKPANRNSMIRIILFLALIAAAAAGAAWVADQPGDVVLSWGGWRAEMTLPVFVLALGIVVVAGVMLWSVLRGLWRTPQRLRRRRHERRHARGRHAITQGLLPVGHGDIPM